MDTKDIIIIVLVSVVFLIIGMLVGAKLVFDLLDPDDSDDSEPTEGLHCFQCEIEMPVKEKDGELYCKNCGLIHSYSYY